MSLAVINEIKSCMHAFNNQLTSQPELRKENPDMPLTILLICIVNRVSDKVLPCGTPFSCNFIEM